MSEPGDDRQARDDLKAPPDQNRSPERSKPFEGQLEADLEEQEDDAELGQIPDSIRFGDEPEPTGTRHRANDQEADNRRQSQPLSRRKSGGCEGQQDDHFNQA